MFFVRRCGIATSRTSSTPHALRWMITATITVDDSEILPLRRPLSSPLSSTGSGGAHRVAANRTGGDHDTEARNLLIAHLLRSHAALPWPGQTCATSPTGRTGAPPACRDGVRSGVVPMARLRLRLRPGYAAAVFVRRYAPNEDGWARRDSNPQGLLHRILNPARLPISPLAQVCPQPPIQMHIPRIRRPRLTDVRASTSSPHG